MIGTIINNYKIISELGQGGMGIIYKAYDIKLDRYVAIKILKSKVTDQQKFTERFKIEAKNQAKLSHVNIVPVYGFIDEAGILGIVMELIEGETLEQLIDRKIRLSLTESITIIKQVLEGTGYAHSRGFIHRDIKPSNIIINKENVAKIMDFGISKSIFEKGITNTGTNIGTLYYMSPEQIKGEDPTIRSDIYSVGITLYEMLSGVVPFNYDNEYQVIEGHLKESAPDLLGKSPELPNSIQKIIEKAISKKPQNRYCSHQEFIDDLKQLESYINKFYLPKPEQKNKRSFRYKLKAVTYTFGLLTLGLGLFYFSYNQVNELWKSGVNPLLTLIKNKDENSEIRKLASNKLNWNMCSSGVKNNLNSVCFINDSLGFCCGSEGTLLFTNNHGYTWQKNTAPPSGKELLSICFNAAGEGFLIDESAVFKTTDLGKSWTEIKINSFGKKLFKIQFFDGKMGFITGSNGLMLKTTDGGNSWYQTETRTSNLLYDLAFSDAKRGFAVGWNGEMLETTDAGDTWLKRNSLTNNYLKRIRFINSLEGFIIGGNGEVFKTTDGGGNWMKLKNDQSFGLHDIEFIDENIALIIGSQGKTLMSTDRGNSWMPVQTNVYAGLQEFSLTPGKKLFSVGANGTIVRL